MIQHTVTFKLHATSGSPEEAAFIKELRALSAIPGVIDFKVHQQIGKKNEFDFGATMFFANDADYQQYNNHPDHVAFVNGTWLPQVADFLEIDYIELPD